MCCESETRRRRRRRGGGSYGIRIESIEVKSLAIALSRNGNGNGSMKHSKMGSHYCEWKKARKREVRNKKEIRNPISRDDKIYNVM